MKEDGMSRRTLHKKTKSATVRQAIEDTRLALVKAKKRVIELEDALAFFERKEREGHQTLV